MENRPADSLMLLYNDLYFKKSQKMLRDTISYAKKFSIGDIFKGRLREYVDDANEKYDSLLDEICTKMKRYTSERERNWTRYYYGNRSYLVYLIIKCWIKIKYFIWIFIWYLSR